MRGIYYGGGMRKEDFIKVRELNAKIIKLELRIVEIDSELSSIKSTSDFKLLVQESIKKSDYKERLIEEKNEISETKKFLIKEFEELRKRIKLFIENSNLSDLEKRLLSDRYVKCLPWNRIQHLRHYSPSYIFQIHDRALKKIK